MKYALLIPFGGIPRYILDEESNDTTINPNFALNFQTKRDAKEWIKENVITDSLDTNSLVVSLEDAKHKYEDFELSFMRFGKFKRREPTKDVPYQGGGMREILNFHYHRRDEDGVSYETFKTYPRLWETTMHGWDTVSYYTDDFAKTENSVILVFRRGKADFQTFKDELEVFVEFVDRKMKGNYRLSVFDRFLSEGGNTVDVLVSPDLRKASVISRRDRQIVPWSNLETIFEYIVQERYYED